MDKAELKIFFEKHGSSLTEHDKEMDDLGKKIERDVKNHSHLDQLAGGHILMRNGDDICQITRKFKECLMDLSYDLSEVTLRDIRIRTGYPEETVLDIIKYIGSDIIAKETSGITHYSLGKDR